MNDAHQPQLEAPRLRTLLLTDLCDSTELVEKLGDSLAAELFREHDHMVLILQREWRARLIDRSDGLLLLFERPIDGLGFALDYARGLQELGNARQLKLHARAGLHVGEVLTWRNSDEAVSIGAKPLEVEGLAKPMAARLMTLARPGQILISAVAESLTHRASRELGERGDRLLWKSHGRWRFKGIPTAQEIYEVGEVGLTPLRSPKSSGKAWRDLPLWRRPAALAVEVVLAAAIAIGVWIAMRPEPAIAFAERDWVVIGDVRNLTGNTLLDGSLEQAFRISLMQSHYVNLLSDMKIREALERMQRDPSGPLDRATASEVALREGARAVILPTVVADGTGVTFSAEVIDPADQTTVYAVSGTGKGTDKEILAAVGNVAGRLRTSLGETLEQVHASQRLPTVVTASLDALRAYALGKVADSRDQVEEARRYYEEALRLDPGFAMAELGLFQTFLSQADYRNAEVHLRKALALGQHLPQRDELYLQAWAAEFGNQPGRNAPIRWKMLSAMYPDFMAGHLNYSWWQFTLGATQEAYLAAQKAATIKDVNRVGGYRLMGRAALAQNRYNDAIRLLTLAQQSSNSPMDRYTAAAYAAARREPEAGAAIAALNPSDENPFPLLESIAYRVDRGELQSALALSGRAIGLTEGGNNLLVEGPFQVTRLTVRLLAEAGRVDYQSDLQALTARLLQAAEQGNEGEKDSYVAMTCAAARLGQRYFGRSVSQGVLQRLQIQAERSGSSRALGLIVLLHAENARLAGTPREAIRLLASLLDGSEHFQVHVALRDAYRDAGDIAQVQKQDLWLATHRGTAYADPTGAQAFVVANIADSDAAASPSAVSLSRDLSTASRAGS